MSEDKKNPKEASNIFHSIMKASIKPKKVICPVCGADAKLISDKNYECSKGHKVTE
ncbi:MAG: hypothetical protein V4560_08680 [Bacteroidota bacterium]|jgi:hypothetical protein